MDITPNTPTPHNAADLPWRYDAVTVALHWAVALLITALAALGWTMMAIEDDPGSRWYFDQHKSFGLVLALLVALRIIWRATRRGAPPAETGPAWQAKLARAVQGLLYLLMVAIPTAGYLGASHSKSGVAWFGLATPRWALPNHDTAEWFFGIHAVLVWVLVGCVVLHVAGALWHWRVNKDQVLQRMGWR